MTEPIDLSSQEGLGYLGRFVLDKYRDTVLTSLVARAREELLALAGERLFSGYDSGKVSLVHSQVHALYNALFKLKPEIECTENQETWLKNALKTFVRSPAEIIDQAHADSLDIAVMMACLLFQNGLHPLLFFLAPEGSKSAAHVVLGYWLSGSRNLPTAIGNRASVEPFMEEIALLEATGCLAGIKQPFPQALIEGLLCAPTDLQTRARQAMPVEARENARDNSSASEEDIRIVNVIDIHGLRREIGEHIPVITVMGARGGVGKTTIVARMAELMAESGKNVLIIDLDLQHVGSTDFHSKRVLRGQPTIKMVIDHMLPYSTPVEQLPQIMDTLPTDERFWDVTPSYLAADSMGRICLLPSRPLILQSDIFLANVVGNIKAEEKQGVSVRELNNMLQRTDVTDVRINCVIIDCGADYNTLVAAAMYRANYGFIVALPSEGDITNVRAIHDQQRYAFPRTDIRNLQVIVNRSVGPNDESRWSSMRPAGFVPYSNEFFEHWVQGVVDFRLGYDDVSLSIRNILGKTLRGPDQALVPDEYTVWLRPWIEEALQYQLPQRMLPIVHRRKMLGLVAILILALVLLASGFVYSRSSTVSDRPPSQMVRIAMIQTDTADQAQDILKRVQAGSDFAALAGMLSTDASTRDRGGVLETPIQIMDPLPTIGKLDGLSDCLARVKVGSICNGVFGNGQHYYLVKLVDAQEGTNPLQGVGFLGILIVVLALVGMGIYVWGQGKNERILQTILDLASRQDGQLEKYFADLLRQPKRGALKWVYKQFNLAIKARRQQLFNNYLQSRGGRREQE